MSTRDASSTLGRRPSTSETLVKSNIADTKGRAHTKAVSDKVFNRGGAVWRWRDLVYFIPILGMFLIIIVPSRNVNRSSKQLVLDRIHTAEAFALFGALLLSIIGTSYVSLEMEEVRVRGLYFTVGPYACITETLEGSGDPQKTIDLAGGLAGLGIAAIALAFIALVLSFVGMIGATGVSSNSSAHERKRWWKITWPIFVGSPAALLMSTGLCAWFYLRVYLLKYEQALRNSCGRYREGCAAGLICVPVQRFDQNKATIALTRWKLGLSLRDCALFHSQDSSPPPLSYPSGRALDVVTLSTDTP